MSGIFFLESNDRVVDPWHLWYGTCQLDIVNHLKVSLLGIFRLLDGGYAPHNRSYISYGRPRMLIFPSRSLLLGWIHSLLVNEPLQLSLPNKGFNLLFQVVVVSCVMVVITVETTILSLDLLLGSPFSLPGKVKAPSSLICIKTWSIRAISGVKLVNFPIGSLEHLSSRCSPVLAIFHPLSGHMSSCLSLFLGFSSWASSASSTFMYLVAL